MRRWSACGSPEQPPSPPGQTNCDTQSGQDSTNHLKSRTVRRWTKPFKNHEGPNCAGIGRREPLGVPRSTAQKKHSQFSKPYQIFNLRASTPWIRNTSPNQRNGTHILKGFIIIKWGSYWEQHWVPNPLTRSRGKNTKKKLCRKIIKIFTVRFNSSSQQIWSICGRKIRDVLPDFIPTWVFFCQYNTHNMSPKKSLIVNSQGFWFFCGVFFVFCFFWGLFLFFVVPHAPAQRKKTGLHHAETISG